MARHPAARRQASSRRAAGACWPLMLLGLGLVSMLLVSPAQAQPGSVQPQAAAQVDADGAFRIIPGDKQEVAVPPADAAAPPPPPPPPAAEAPAAPAAEAAPAAPPAPPAPPPPPADAGGVAPAPPADEAAPAPGGVADAPAPDGGIEEGLAPAAPAAPAVAGVGGAVAPKAPIKKKPGAPMVPGDIEVADDGEEEDTPVRGGKKKPTKATSSKKRPTYNAEAAGHWQDVPAVEVTVNSYEDEDGAVCSRDSPTCNLRAALTFVGNRQGTIYLPTVEVHKLKKGPVMVPMYAHVTITSAGTSAQKKAVIYHRESSTFGGGNTALLVVPENTTLTLDAVTFKNNPRRAVYGDRGADITVLNCAFVNNTFDAEGAAIRVDAGRLHVKQTLFYNNTDWSSGGAIYTTYSTLTIEGTNFLNNSASSGAALKAYQSEVDISGSHFSGGTAWSDGGAIEMVESTGKVYDNIMEYNTASSGGCVKLVGSNITFSGMEFRKNSCKNTGAVFDAYLSNTTIESCMFRKNWAMNVGGCISGYQTQYNTYDSTFEFNKAESAGAVISLLEAQLFDFGSTFQNNTAFMGGVVNVEENAYVHLRGSIIKGNMATGNGAAVRINKAHAYLEDVYAINNTVLAESGGAAIYGEGGYLDTYLGTYTNHTSYIGPVIHVINTTTNLNSTMFIFNEAATLGGAIWIQNSEFASWNTTFYRNHANKGGAVFIQNEVTVEDLERPKFVARRIRFLETTFLENVATEAGGAIEMSLAENVSTLNGAFIRNNATEFGGAVHMESSNATFVGTRFESNRAKFGAAVETYMSEFRTVDCVIAKNEASWGGALEFKVSTFKCGGSTFEKNQAKFDGGALNCQNSTLELEDCVIKGNVGENNAGGFWLESSNMTATGTRFEGNQAKARDGGAIFSYDTDAKFRGCIFGSNAARKGPDLYNHGGLAEVYCAHIGETYNKPKVGGHITQDCFTCPNGQYGDYASAGSLTCETECKVTSKAMSCYTCPNELACDGQRTCKPGYRGEQCMDCKGGFVKVDGQCQPMAAMAIVVIVGFFTMGAFIFYLMRGPVLDANQFTRVKIVWSLLQLLVMVGLIHNAFGSAVPFFLGLLKPLTMWFDLGTLGSMAKHSFVGIHIVNLFFPVLILIVLIKVQDVLYKRKIHALENNVMNDALVWLKHERRIGQLTLLFAELSWAPILYQAVKPFQCYDTAHGPALLWEPSMQCGGTPGQFILRGLSVMAFVVVGVVFPLVLRYILVSLNQQDRLFHPATREIYKALYESYLEDRLFYDLVFLGVRAALLLPLLATHSGFVQSMIMLSMMGLYYFYYRGNSPFIKFEDQDDVEHPNLHYRAEESKVGVVTFWLVAAAIGSKSEDMVEICGWMFVFLNLIVLAFVFRNLGLGIKNINKEPTTEDVLALRDGLRLDPSIKGQSSSDLFTQSGWRGFLTTFFSFASSTPSSPSSLPTHARADGGEGGSAVNFRSLSAARASLARLSNKEGKEVDGVEGVKEGGKEGGGGKKRRGSSAASGVEKGTGVAINIGESPRKGSKAGGKERKGGKKGGVAVPAEAAKKGFWGGLFGGAKKEEEKADVSASGGGGAGGKKKKEKKEKKEGEGAGEERERKKKSKKEKKEGGEEVAVVGGEEGKEGKKKKSKKDKDALGDSSTGKKEKKKSKKPSADLSSSAAVVAAEAGAAEAAVVEVAAERGKAAAPAAAAPAVVNVPLSPLPAPSAIVVEQPVSPPKEEAAGENGQAEP